MKNIILKNQKNPLILAASLMLLMSPLTSSFVQAHGIQNNTSTGQKVENAIDDASITAAIKSKIMVNFKINAMNVNVDTEHGVVSLNGTAQNATEKKQIGIVAKDTEGVLKVKNNLIISKDSNVNPQTLSAKVESGVDNLDHSKNDDLITTRVEHKLSASKANKEDDISVTTHEGVVTLSGTVKSDTNREMIIHQTSVIKGVKKVISTDLTVKKD